MSVRVLVVVALFLASGCNSSNIITGGGSGESGPERAILVGPVSGPVTEWGGQATFTLVLNRRPSHDVTVSFGSTDATEGVLGVTAVTFTNVNWDAPQTVTVTGVDDAEADGLASFAISFLPTASEDDGYAELTPSDLPMANVDDDTAGVIVAPVTGSTTEAGGQASLTVVLASQPTGNVSVALDSSDVAEGTLGVASLAFTPANWNAPQSVILTGVDDPIADGNQVWTVSFQVSSIDPDFAGVLVPSVPVTNVDDDSAGVLVSAVSGATTEAGGQATFSVVLTAQPTASITVPLASADVTEGTVSTTSLTFTTMNWSAPQTVTVTGADDDLADGNQPYAVLFSPLTGGDAAYSGMTLSPVPLTNVDDDSAGIVVSAPTSATTEAGGQATFTVALTSQPTADVTVNFSSDALDEGTLSTSSLTFTTTAPDWSTPKTVTVTGMDDDLADGNQPYAVVFAATTTTDPDYAAITPSNVPLTNVDDESAGILVSAPSGPTTEAAGQATFTIRLASQPTAPVTVNFAGNDPGEATLSATSVGFTTADWMTPKTVTATGVDDDLADGNQPWSVVFSVTGSGDAAYAAITPANLVFTNVDDDTAGILVSAASGPTSEAGLQATFTVVLTSQPSSNVIVSFDSNDLTEGTLSATSLTFTSAAGDWDGVRTVTVTGADDALADGDVTYAVTFSATTGDAQFAGLTPLPIALVNLDDETTGDVDECPDGAWSGVPSLPQPRSSVHVAGINGKVYVAGGFSGGSTSTLQIYDPSSSTWSTGGSMPAPRYQGQSVAIDGKMYVAGGWTGSLPTSTLYRYDPVANAWATLASLPILSGCGLAGEIDGKMYMTTPCDGNSGYRNFLHVYDPATNGWTALTGSPDAHNAAFGGVIGGKLYVAGGHNGAGTLYGKLDVYDPATNMWTAKADMPTPRYGGTSAVIDGKLYAMGGSGAAYSGVVEVYDPVTDTWSSAASMTVPRQSNGAVLDGVAYAIGGSTATSNPDGTAERYVACRGGTWVTKTSMLPRYSPTATAINGKLYVTGGHDGTSGTDTLQIYDPATDAWSTGATMPGTRYVSAAAEIGGKLYVAGGWTSLPTSSLFRYDPATNGWTTLASMPVLSACGVAGVINGKLYVTTSCDGNSGYRSYLHVYDPATNAWAALPDSPNPHGAGPAGGVIGGKLYVAGGADTAGNAHGKTDVYDPATNSWTTMADMPTARHGVTGAVINGQLYAFGGNTGSTVLNKVEVYDPVSNTWRNAPSMPTARQGSAAANVEGIVYVTGGDSGGTTGNLSAYLP